MDEFGFIRACLAPLAGPEGLGLLDDAAVMTPRPGYDLVLTKDTMVEGVHFPKGHHGADVAGKLLRVNLSDLAAKGARPIGYLLSIAWPKSLNGDDFERRARDFASGLKAVQGAFGFHLFGGDTVRTDGPMVVSATFIGEVPTRKMVRRTGAKPGDDVWVSGVIGDAYLGLQVITANIDFVQPAFSTHQKTWLDAYWRPAPRLALIDMLQDLATASADVSDGLIADIGHIAKASGVRMVLGVGGVPLSNGARAMIEARVTDDLLMDAITGGDDYEIAFTAHPSSRAAIIKQAQHLNILVTRIGSCSQGQGVECRDEHDHVMTMNRPGYSHF